MTTRLLVSVLFMAGCATGYHAQGFAGGFSETQLDENVFQVTFRGNGYTSGERAADFTLLRSAEVAREHGYGYFIIVEKVDRTGYGAYTTPATSETTASATSYGNTTYGSATTTTYGGHTYLTRKPGLADTIVCFKDRPKDVKGLVYNADSVYRSLTQKYGIQPMQDTTQPSTDTPDAAQVSM
jgi:hypothetical protein